MRRRCFFALAPILLRLRLQRRAGSCVTESCQAGGALGSESSARTDWRRRSDVREPSQAVRNARFASEQFPGVPPHNPECPDVAALVDVRRGLNSTRSSHVGCGAENPVAGPATAGCGDRRRVRAAADRRSWLPIPDRAPWRGPEVQAITFDLRRRPTDLGVGGLQVAMNDAAALVSRLSASADLPARSRALPSIGIGPCAMRSASVGPVDEFHDQERPRSRPTLRDRESRAMFGVVERGQHPRLAVEPRQPFLIGGERGTAAP